MTPHHDQLRFRLWVGGSLVREDWLPGASLEAGAELARAHARISAAAEDRGEQWLVEVYDPDAPPDEGHMRFGTDTSGMVAPVAVVMFGSDDTQ